MIARNGKQKARSRRLRRKHESQRCWVCRLPQATVEKILRRVNTRVFLHQKCLDKTMTAKVEGAAA